MRVATSGVDDDLKAPLCVHCGRGRSEIDELAGPSRISYVGLGARRDGGADRWRGGRCRPDGRSGVLATAVQPGTSVNPMIVATTIRRGTLTTIGR